MIGTASWLEIVWVVMGAVALRYNLIVYLEIKADYEELRTLGRNGGYLIKGRMMRRRELERVLTQLGLLLMGLIGLFLPEPVSVSVSAGRLVSQLLLMGYQVWLTRAAQLDVKGNKALDEYIVSHSGEAR